MDAVRIPPHICLRDHLMLFFKDLVIAPLYETPFSRIIKCKDLKTLQNVAIKVMHTKELREYGDDCQNELRILCKIKEKDPNGSSYVFASFLVIYTK
jgi:hypothetical protein